MMALIRDELEDITGDCHFPGIVEIWGLSQILQGPKCVKSIGNELVG